MERVEIGVYNRRMGEKGSVKEGGGGRKLNFFFYLKKLSAIK